jgi:hypothetical protein
MEYKKFPLMGFPKETNQRDQDIIYRCWFEGGRIAMWRTPYDAGLYALNMYHCRFTDESVTHVQDRINPKQGPIYVSDVLEAQLAINWLIQTYLPTEVTNDFSSTIQEQRRPVPAEDQTRAMHAYAAAGEAVE